MAEVIVLPVVRVERVPGAIAVEFGAPAAPVTDINEFRHARARGLAERRERTTLLPCDCGVE